jgi:hypothetical protein
MVMSTKKTREAGTILGSLGRMSHHSRAKADPARSHKVAPAGATLIRPNIPEECRLSPRAFEAMARAKAEAEVLESIRRHDREYQAHVGRGVPHGYAAGRWLDWAIENKLHGGHGHLASWIASNFTFSPRQARKYRLMARKGWRDFCARADADDWCRTPGINKVLGYDKKKDGPAPRPRNRDGAAAKGNKGRKFTFVPEDDLTISVEVRGDVLDILVTGVARSGDDAGVLSTVRLRGLPLDDARRLYKELAHALTSHTAFTPETALPGEDPDGGR